MKISMKAIAPAAVMGVALALAGGMISLRHAPDSNQPSVQAPLVRTVQATSGPVQFTITAHGTVEPRTESDLVSEIAGRITWVSPRMQAGAFFAAGDTLLRFDADDYQANLESSRAALARAESQLTLARATLERERSMRKGGAASKAQLDQAIHAEQAAAAGIREARVAVSRAERDLDRCTIRAPFAGRVRDQFADVGQFVGRGIKLARIYSVDHAEVRLPISDDDLAFLDLPMGYRDDPLLSEELDVRSGEASPTRTHPEVHLSARFAGKRHTWIGRIVRSEGTLDPQTRMITVVARIDDPYGRGQVEGRPPLSVGLFVEARILGRVIEGLVEIPRGAILSGSQVAVVGPDERLELREVEVVRAGSERVWVAPRETPELGTGLVPGESICLSSLPTMVTGMQVRSQPNPSLVARSTGEAKP